jgi:hypothetical protein
MDVGSDGAREDPIRGEKPPISGKVLGNAKEPGGGAAAEVGAGDGDDGGVVEGIAVEGADVDGAGVATGA